MPEMDGYAVCKQLKENPITRGLADKRGRMRLNTLFNILLIITCHSVVLAEQAFQPQLIQLSQAEKQWLDSQDELHFGITHHQKPVCFENSSGEIDGIIPAYIVYLEKAIGKKIRISIVGNPIIVLNRSKELGLHGMISMFKATNLKKLYLYSQPYMNTPLYVFVTKNKQKSIQKKADLSQKKVAVIKGHHLMSEYLMAIQGVNKVEVNSPKEQMELLQYGEVDAIVGYISYHYMIRELFFYNIVPAFSTDKRFGLCAGVFPEYSLLKSILDKAISSIPKSVMQGIHEQWFHSAHSADNYIFELSKQEHEWINKKFTVRTRVAYWPPYMFKTPEPSGMSVDYLKYIAERYGLRVNFIPAQLNWTDSLEDLKTDRKHYDLILTMNPTLERKKLFSLSEPYLSIPWVIFTRADTSLLDSINDLNDKTVAVERGYVMCDKLARQYPEIKLNIVKNSLAALKSLSTGESFAYIGNLANSTYLIREHGLNNLKVALPTPFEDHTQAMAVRKDWPELTSIINKGLQSMTQKDHDEIKNKWSSIRFEHGIDQYDVAFWILTVVLIAGSIILIFVKVNKRLNREIKMRIEAMEKTRIADKAKGDFLANMSHEIRTPLNAIIGLSDLALKTNSPDKHRDYITKVLSASQSLLGIVDDILDFSKIEAGKLRLEKIPFKLASVLENLSNVISMKAEEKGLELLLNVEKDIPMELLGDPLRLGQILLNLCNNAIKFTNQGEVAIHIKRIETANESISLEFSVCDTGIGMTQEQISKLFQSFSQVDTSVSRKYGGTGLGLAISKQLSELMDGSIRVESEPVKGSQFTFTACFEIVKDEKEIIDENSPLFMSHFQRNSDQIIAEKNLLLHQKDADLSDISGAKVLLVEDNEMNQQVARELLEVKKLDVHIAENGIQAIEMIENNSFDIVLISNRDF